MSRSYKKNPVSKHIRTITKEQASRMFRRINKIKLRKDEELLHRYEVVSPYDINDWIFRNWKGVRWYNEEYDKIKRK